ncbi:WD40 repeat-like protein [Violaceomyces palustris]|uniref:WD40 repeat-like protein n=1 Tax=Violaceomyces palustris TaxID=1673888 RepID=A0ACD0NS64_9BASI|nr:WD40 repeat-like protein [Violaceomyces palustris]
MRDGDDDDDDDDEDDGSDSISTSANRSNADKDPAGVFKPLYPGSSLDKNELVRLTLQSLREMGFETTAKSLEAESGLTLEHPSITAFRSAVLSGDWRNAERLLVDGLTYGATRQRSSRYLGLAGSSNLASGVSLDSTRASTGIPFFVRPKLTLDARLCVFLSPRRQTRIEIQSIKFMLHQQRYLELLEAGQTKKALSVLRDKLTPLNQGTHQLHQLSSLVMCASPEELRTRANWDGSRGDSRRSLLKKIEAAVSPTVMVPSRRLPQLLEQAQTLQKQLDPFFNLPSDAHISLFVDHQSDRSVFPSQTAQVLIGHNDEVWHLEFSRDGTKLVTASKDRYAIVWKVGEEYDLLQRLGPHADHVSCVTWSPDDKTILSTAETEISLWDVGTGLRKKFRHHEYTVGTAAWLPDGTAFITGGMDGRIILWGTDGKPQREYATSPFRVLALAVSPDGQHMIAVSTRPPPITPIGSSSRTGHQHHSVAPPSSGTSSSHYSSSPSPTSTSGGERQNPDAAGSDSLAGGSRSMGDERQRIHFYEMDGSQFEEVGSVYLRQEMSSVAISQDSRYALINQRPDEAQIWDIQKQCFVRRFNGHRISKHIIRGCFGGFQENFVVSGSEDGLVYIWHRMTGRLIETLRGHEEGSVNAVAWHPFDHSMIASCSDDHTVRIWRPGTPSPARKPSNKDETKDTFSDENAAVNPFPWTDAVSSPMRAGSESAYPLAAEDDDMLDA